MAWCHPHEDLRSSVTRLLAATTTVEDSGTRHSVVREGRVRRHHVPGASTPAEASPAQREVLSRYRVRAGVGAPVIWSAGEVVGGVALLRFGQDAPFTDRDDELLTTFAAEVSGLVELLRRWEAG